MGEYKRLTKKDKYGHWYTETKINDRFMWSKDGKVWERDLSHYAFDGEAIDRLAELEDKIEYGTLLDIKFRLGDTVWFYGFSDKTIYKGKVIGINFNAYTPQNPIWIKIQYDIPMVKQDCDTEVWESMVFTTESEAEVRLKELQENKNDKNN